VRRSSGEELLIVDIHHIIADGYSTGILWREVSEIIRGVSLAPLRITCGDYAVWQRGDDHAKELAAQREFWTKQFATLPAPLQLPYDSAIPPCAVTPAIQIANCRAQISTSSFELSRAQESTLFAARELVRTLSRIGGSDDVVVGVRSRARTRIRTTSACCQHTACLRPARSRTSWRTRATSPTLGARTTSSKTADRFSFVRCPTQSAVRRHVRVRDARLGGH
jgi:hypothetical protein